MQSAASASLICPDLTAAWILGKVEHLDQIMLRSRQDERQFPFTLAEGFALRHFTGHFTLEQVQSICEQHLKEAPANLVLQVWQKLNTLGILSASAPRSGPQLKACVQWIAHPGGYWILRNPENVTFLQVSERDQRVIDQLGQFSPTELVQRHAITTDDLRRLLQLLSATGMLEGTQPAKSSKRKFTPLQLLFFRIPLFNPDRWLTQHVHRLHWIWTTPIAFLLGVFLVASAVVALAEHAEIVMTGQKLWAAQGATILVPFLLLCGVVVALHELAHAFTLKHYGGIVPEIGLLVMCLMPGCYTNTTDSYCLIKRRQRTLVVGAGILCQLTLWAIALWSWRLLTPGTWLQTASYLLMAAALLTVALNLNPLAKLDGYYLAVALTGINNLRSRSFLFYANLLRRRPLNEHPRDRGMLALYAPLSVLYTLLVFGHLLLWLTTWILTHIPLLALSLFALWAIYFYVPFRSSTSPSTMTATPSPNAARPPLQVVPPSATTTSTAPSTLARTSRSYRSWWIAGAIVLGVGAIGLFPVSDSVSGDAAINATPGARQIIAMPEAATVKAISVRMNDRVTAGQVIAELDSYELEQQLLDIDRKLAEAQAERETARQQFNLALSRQIEAQTKVQASTQRATRLQQELGQWAAGSVPPRIRQLQSEQTERQSQINGLHAQLAIINTELDRNAGLVDQGILAVSRLDEPKRQQAALLSQIASTQAQIQTLNEQIAAMQKTMQDEWSDQRQPDVAAAIAAVNSAQQEVIGTQSLVQRWERQLPLLQAQRQQLLQRQETLRLRASVTGTVITPDLDLLLHQKLAEGKELLTIADATQPTAVVELPQVDASRVRVGMPVTFRLQDGDLQGFNAKVQEIPPIVMPDQPQQPQQKAMVKVRIVFDDAKQSFAFGTKGYGHIQIGQRPLYQKVQQELLKLFPVGRFV